MENTLPPTSLPPKTLHYYLVADRSGSMSDQIEEVRDEINKHLLELASDSKESNTHVRLHLLVFNSQLDWIFTGQSIDQVMPLTHQQYHAKGNTALFDAAGQAIEWASNSCPNELDPEKEEVVIMIFSDGQENSSRKFDGEQFTQLVERHQARIGWTIAFSGCDLQGLSQLRNSKWRNDRMLSYSMDEKSAAMRDMAYNVSERMKKREMFFEMRYQKRDVPHDSVKLDDDLVKFIDDLNKK